MTITVKKLWYGSCSLRDYIVNNAIKDEDVIVVTYGNEKMTLYPSDLKKGKLTNVKSKSQFSGKTYSLIDFPWEPDLNKEGD